MFFVPQRRDEPIGRVIDKESVRERGVFRGQMIFYVGLVSKDHDCLQSLPWSVVRGARLEQAVIS
jgi:hypothetical protein